MSSALNNSSVVVFKCPQMSFGNISHKKLHIFLEVFKMIEILMYLF